MTNNVKNSIYSDFASLLLEPATLQAIRESEVKYGVIILGSIPNTLNDSLLGKAVEAPSVLDKIIKKITTIFVFMLYLLYNPCKNYFKVKDGEMVKFTLSDSIEYTVSEISRANDIREMKVYLNNKIHAPASLDSLKKDFALFKRISVIFSLPEQKILKSKFKELKLNYVLASHSEFLIQFAKDFAANFIKQEVLTLRGDFILDLMRDPTKIDLLFKNTDFRKEFVTRFMQHLEKTLTSNPLALSIFLEIGEAFKGELTYSEKVKFKLAENVLPKRFVLSAFEKLLNAGIDEGDKVFNNLAATSFDTVINEGFNLLKTEIRSNEKTKNLFNAGIEILLDQGFAFLKAKLSNDFLNASLKTSVQQGFSKLSLPTQNSADVPPD